MKHLLTAIACCFALAGSAQSDAYPFNPDSDGDGLIGVEDLLALLSDFGMPAELETCFKGTLCKAIGCGYCYIPEGVGTIFTKRPYNGGRTLILPTTNYSNGDVIHISCGYEYYYGGNVNVTYLDSTGYPVGIGGFAHSYDTDWNGGGDSGASVIFENGIWVWQGHQWVDAPSGENPYD